MDKTININLAGILFQIDEEAFRILRDYLQAINNRFGNSQEGHETIEDIESRIAEIFQSQKGLAGVIMKENVESMISIIGKPEDFEQGESEPLNSAAFASKRRMYRNPDDIIVSGVSSGIAAYLDTDPVIFRILFVLFTLFFGVGLLIYLALWIALPVARTDSQKRDLYGSTYHKSITGLAINTTGAASQGYSPSRVGNAVNEVFRAVGKVFYIIFRIFLIFIGVTLVITGFLSIFCYTMSLLYPGIFSFDSSGINLVNIPAFLRYVVNPSSVPWIMILTTISFILPMLALIYWGVKMVFWFRARDGVVSLIAFVVWIMSISALAIIGFNEGVSFAETAKVSAETVIQNKTDTLYIRSVNKVANLKYQNVISIPHDEYSVFINDDLKQLYIRPFLNVEKSDDNKIHLEVTRRSAGRTEREANQKAEELKYEYSVSGDSLKIDEYFTLPAGRKWSADNVGIHLYVPAGTVLKFDETSKILVHSHIYDGSEDYYESHWEVSGPGIWAMTDDGLVTAYKKTKQK
jgi:phage shock protein PspC (stress-responsive transcriptional regulator)